ncbi:MAG: hypothetical protein Q9192_007444, partial [Flavoplaca navasiana]
FPLGAKIGTPLAIATIIAIFVWWCVITLELSLQRKATDGKPTGGGRNGGEQRTISESTLVGLQRTQRAGLASGDTDDKFEEHPGKARCTLETEMKEKRWRSAAIQGTKGIPAPLETIKGGNSENDRSLMGKLALERSFTDAVSRVWM